MQGWGVTMVLPSTMVKALHLETNPSAYVARRVYAALLAGELQPPSDREIGVLNASGELVLLILHYLGGTKIGTTPLEYQSRPGVYEFRMSLPRHDDASDTVQISAGGNAVTTTVMQYQYGLLQVATAPLGASVTVKRAPPAAPAFQTGHPRFRASRSGRPAALLRPTRRGMHGSHRS